MKYIPTILLSFFVTNLVVAKDVIISDKSYHISKDILGEFTEFSIEFISDYTNNLEGKYPKIDFASILVDINANSKLDSGIDRYYGQSRGKSCAGFLLTNRSSKPCGSFKSGAKVFSYFIKTDANPMPHPVIKFLIPTAELLTSKDGVHLLFKVHNSETGYTYYPSKLAIDSFSTTYKVRL